MLHAARFRVPAVGLGLSLALLIASSACSLTIDTGREVHIHHIPPDSQRSEALAYMQLNDLPGEGEIFVALAGDQKAEHFFGPARHCS